MFFVLNREEYEHAAKLVEEAMSSADSEAAGKFISVLPSLRSAVLKLKPIKFETADGGKTAKWMTFRVVVIAPAEFQRSAEPERERHHLPFNSSLKSLLTPGLSRNRTSQVLA